MELDRIARVLEKHSEILFAYLYGSVARGEAGIESDIDIGIFLREDFKPGAFYEIGIANEIERECNLRRVEVVVLNKKP
jgi:predicted nucleotidyltransferase